MQKPKSSREIHIYHGQKKCFARKKILWYMNAISESAAVVITFWNVLIIPTIFLLQEVKDSFSVCYLPSC